MMTETELRLEVLKQAVASAKEPGNVLTLASTFLDWVTDTESHFQKQLDAALENNPSKLNDMVAKIQERISRHEMYMRSLFPEIHKMKSVHVADPTLEMRDIRDQAYVKDPVHDQIRAAEMTSGIDRN